MIISSLEENELIVPASKFSVDLKIDNNESVAFDYKIKLDVDLANSGSNLIKRFIVKVD